MRFTKFIAFIAAAATLMVGCGGDGEEGKKPTGGATLKADVQSVEVNNPITFTVTAEDGTDVTAEATIYDKTHNFQEVSNPFTPTEDGRYEFYAVAGNAITEVETKYNPEQFNLTIAYTPTVENTTEQPTITLSVLGNEKTFDGLISARSLPNIFAIVAKVGNIWYALPSQGLNSTDDLMGYAIEVDNQDDPTLVTSAPANADWSLRQVYAGQNANATKDRFKQYGNNLVFVNSDVKALNASSTGSHVLTDAQYEEFMFADLHLLTLCDSIYMLRGWEQSLGANREVGFALGCGMQILYEPEEV